MKKVLKCGCSFFSKKRFYGFLENRMFESFKTNLLGVPMTRFSSSRFNLELKFLKSFLARLS